MWRTIVAVTLIAHGLVHLIGFVVPWRIATLDGFPYRADVLSDVEIGSSGVKVLGILWLLAAIGFVAVGVALLAGQSWWWGPALVIASVSLLLAGLWAQQAFAGLAIDLAIIAILALSSWARGLATG